MTILADAVTYVKNNGAFNPEMRHVVLSETNPNDRDLDTPIDITNFIITMVVVNSASETIDTFTTADGSITITDAPGGYFKPLKADISSWVGGETYYCDVKLNDVDGDGLNDASENLAIVVIEGIS